MIRFLKNIDKRQYAFRMNHITGTAVLTHFSMTHYAPHYNKPTQLICLYPLLLTTQ